MSTFSMVPTEVSMPASAFLPPSTLSREYPVLALKAMVPLWTTSTLVSVLSMALKAVLFVDPVVILTSMFTPVSLVMISSLLLFMDATRP